MYTIYCKLRDEKNLKDSDVSKATGITKSTFSDWKKGRSKPKLEKLQLIADFFGVSVDYLMGNELLKPLTLADAIYLNSIKDEKTLTAFSERDRLLYEATERLEEYSEKDLLLILQMLERMPPSKK